MKRILTMIGIAGLTLTALPGCSSDKKLDWPTSDPCVDSLSRAGGHWMAAMYEWTLEFDDDGTATYVMRSTRTEDKPDGIIYSTAGLDVSKEQYQELCKAVDGLDQEKQMTDAPMYSWIIGDETYTSDDQNQVPNDIVNEILGKERYDAAWDAYKEHLEAVESARKSADE